MAADEFFIYKFSREQAGLSGLAFDEGQFGVFGYVTAVRPRALLKPPSARHRSAHVAHALTSQSWLLLNVHPSTESGVSSTLGGEALATCCAMSEGLCISEVCSHFV